jgi:hypothetical protein
VIDINFYYIIISNDRGYSHNIKRPEAIDIIQIILTKPPNFQLQLKLTSEKVVFFL